MTLIRCALVVSLSVSCARSAESKPAVIGDASPAAAPVPSAVKPVPVALKASNPRERVVLEGGDVAQLILPVGATTPRPILVALHGAGDRPEWACDEWNNITESFAFIVCPQGTKTGEGFGWGTATQAPRIVAKAIDDLKRRFSEHVAQAPIVWVGFSMGATMTAHAVRDRGSEIPYVGLVEGAYDTGPFLADRFAASGGKRVLLSCSTGACQSRFANTRVRLQKNGIDVRVFDAPNRGHTMEDEVTTTMREPFAWLVKGEPAWQGLPSVAREKAP